MPIALALGCRTGHLVVTPRAPISLVGCSLHRCYSGARLADSLHENRPPDLYISSSPSACPQGNEVKGSFTSLGRCVVGDSIIRTLLAPSLPTFCAASSSAHAAPVPLARVPRQEARATAQRILAAERVAHGSELHSHAAVLTCAVAAMMLGYPQ
eukprot:5934331-Amphidinium_carterae.1